MKNLKEYLTLRIEGIECECDEHIKSLEVFMAKYNTKKQMLENSLNTFKCELKNQEKK
jgi:hypothetical protein